MTYYKSLIISLLFIIMGKYTYAQNTLPPKSIMLSNGKIYVVMAVVVTIVVGLFIYLISIERKIKKLEN